jgi:ABC-type sugar transport system ATPase subunit
MRASLLRMENVSKSYPGVRALAGVNLTVEAGEAHGLVGKNGAGKSTLIKILGGALRADGGSLLIDGRAVEFHSPADAIANGIGVVHQELSMAPDLSVAENLMLGNWPRKWGQSVDWRRLRSAARQALERVGCDLDPRAPVRGLSLAQKQMVEIARALQLQLRILVMDEPTSSLTDADADRLIATVRTLAESGVGIIYISHRLREIEALCLTLTILRDGRTVDSRPMAEFSRVSVVEQMIGPASASNPAAVRRRPPPNTGPVALRVSGLGRDGAFKDVSFELRRGEILGLAGLVGSGRTELMRAIFGRDRLDAGTIEIEGTPVPRPSPATMRRLGLGFVPEERKDQGLVLGMNVSHNMTLAYLANIARAGFLRIRRETSIVGGLMTRLGIKAAGASAPVETLSGGNQQKVVIAKWLMRSPRILMLDEPTRGVDVQAKAQIFAILRELAAENVAILFISSELEEVAKVSDRVLTMSRGRIVADTPADKLIMREIFLASNRA